MMKRCTSSLFLLAGLICSQSCSKGKNKEAAGKGGSKAIPVESQLAAFKTLPRIIEVVTVLEGRKQAEVYSRVAGKLSYIGPAEGQKVKEGDILFRIDRSDPSESFLATPVPSPISGWVGRWLRPSIGSPVNAQEAVVIIVDDEALRGRIQLPAEEWLQVLPTTPVKARVGTETRSAQVIGISRAADSTSSRGTITIEIANKNQQWKVGMVATIYLEQNHKSRLLLPASALTITDQGAFVFSIQDGKAQRNRVEFEVLDNDSIEILGGLSEGSEVIIQGVNLVGDGVAVQANQASTKE